jgi:hypothetical protein
MLPLSWLGLKDMLSQRRFLTHIVGRVDVNRRVGKQRCELF